MTTSKCPHNDSVMGFDITVTLLYWEEMIGINGH